MYQQTHLKTTGTEFVQHAEVLDGCTSQCITYCFSFPLYLAGCHNNLLFVQTDSPRACIGYKTANKTKTTHKFSCTKVSRTNLNYFWERYKIHTTIFPLNNLGIVPSTHVPFILFSTLSSSWKKNQFSHKINLLFLNLFITHTWLLNWLDAQSLGQKWNVSPFVLASPF